MPIVPLNGKARHAVKPKYSVVIVGFAAFSIARKTLFDYGDAASEPHVVQVPRINPYLIDGPEVPIVNRSKPICDCPAISYGSFALDDGHYTLSADDRRGLLDECPAASKYIRRFIGGQELLHDEDRFCLWLKDANPAEIARMPALMRRVEKVRKWRQGRGRETTRNLAATPTLFAEIRQPDSNYLAIPTLSSEKRRYIPIAYLTPDVVASNQVYVIATARLWDMGVLHSEMHMAWVRQVCGRLESRYRYSAKLVYNNFPWPEAPTAKQRAAVEAAAQAVLEARKVFPDATLADLYDPLAMPPALVKAHSNLDRAVDLCYRPQPFESDRQRVEHLFALYEKLSAPLLPAAKKSRRKAPSD